MNFKQFILEDKIDVPEEVQIAAVKYDGFSIKYIKNPAEAVKEDAWVIRYIKNPSE